MTSDEINLDAYLHTVRGCAGERLTQQHPQGVGSDALWAGRRFFRGTQGVYAEALADCKDRKVGFFSLEITANGKRGYQSAGYLQFIKSYSSMVINNKVRCFHEMILPDRPTRLYFDIDYTHITGCDFSAQEIRCAVHAFIVHAIKRCRALFQISEEATGPFVVVLSGSTAKKTSFHIIIDIFVKDLVAVNHVTVHIAQSFFADCEVKKDTDKDAEKALRIIEQAIDMGVYSTHSIKSMRMAYSYKFGKPDGILMPVLSSADLLSTRSAATASSPQQFFNSEYFCKTLLQAKLPSDRPQQYIQSELVEFSADENNVERAKKFRRLDGTHQGLTAGVSPEDESLCNNLITYMYGEGHKAVSIKYVQDKEQFIHVLVRPGVCCRLKRPHKHNNQHMLVNKQTQQVRLKCMDPDCVALQTPFSFNF